MFTRKNWIQIGVAAALAVGVVVAQGPGPGMRRGGPHGDRFKEFLATSLGLTDAQKEQAKAIFDAARQSAEPFVAQLKQGHEATREAIKSGKSDQELQQLAERQGALMGQVAAVHTKAFAKFYALLTPEQKEKADKMHEQLRGMMQHRFGRE